MENDIEKKLEEIERDGKRNTFVGNLPVITHKQLDWLIQTVRELKRELDKLAEYTSILAAKPTLENVSTKEAIRSEFMLQLIETNKQAEAENAALKEELAGMQPVLEALDHLHELERGMFCGHKENSGHPFDWALTVNGRSNVVAHGLSPSMCGFLSAAANAIQALSAPAKEDHDKP